jgi:HEPN domain-containing protein
MEQFLKTYQVLYKKAVVDLNSAKVILTSFNEGDIELDLEVICFHLQQCSEKLIKAILDFNKIKYKNTHDLKNLTNLLEKHNICLEKINTLLPLSAYAVDGRYDTIQDDINDIDIYINILDNLTVSIKNILAKEED